MQEERTVVIYECLTKLEGHDPQAIKLLRNNLPFGPLLKNKGWVLPTLGKQYTLNKEGIKTSSENILHQRQDGFLVVSAMFPIVYILKSKVPITF